MNPIKDQPIRVLIAEDVEVNALVISGILEREGIEATIAENGELCLQIARSTHPDLIILDLMLPKLSGLEVLKQLKADVQTRHIEVIICTAKDFKTEADQTKELGAFGFLKKPVVRQDLLALIERLFHRGIDAAGLPEESAAEDEFDPELVTKTGMFRLWGTRGSIPISGSRFARHGGNTSCLEVVHGEDRVIFDAGSGIRDLGLSFVSGAPCKIHLFITHTHWDHIQGFPFFAPAYLPGYEITVYAASNVEKDLKSIFQGQLDRAYFPVQLEDMKANLVFRNLDKDPVQIGSMKITWEYTLHPSPTVGYKIEIGGKSLVFIPDNEFLKGYVGRPDVIVRDDERVEAHDNLIGFLKNVDVLIHEAQYTPQEYSNKIGWGHTSISNGSVLVKLSGAKRWIVTHHDPLHDDHYLENKLNLTQQILQDLDCGVQVLHAYDEMEGFL